MKVLEIYSGLQGEGLRVGTPSIFVRTAGCNLDCVWCDTQFSIAPAPEEVTEYTPKDLAGVLLEDKYSNFAHIVLTGGEPMIQRDIEDVIDELHLSRSCYITVETNGTILSGELFSKNVNLWSVSPKLASASTKMLNVDYGWWINLWKNAGNVQLKFVIAEWQDFRNLWDILEGSYGSFLDWNNIPIILQPADTETVSVSCMMKFIEQEMLNDIKYWKKYNVRLVIQQHKIAWGNERKK